MPNPTFRFGLLGQNGRVYNTGTGSVGDVLTISPSGQIVFATPFIDSSGVASHADIKELQEEIKRLALLVGAMLVELRIANQMISTIENAGTDTERVRDQTSPDL